MYMRGAWAFAFIAGFGVAGGGREPPSNPLADQIFFPVEVKGAGFCIHNLYVYTPMPIKHEPKSMGHDEIRNDGTISFSD